MKLHRIVLLFFLLIPCTASARFSNFFSYVKIGACAIGMQGAFTAVANDYSSTFYNPAGMAFIRCTNIGFMHTQLPYNRTMDVMAIVNPLSKRHAIGISFVSYTFRDVEARTQNTLAPDYIFSCYQRMAWLSYSIKINKQIALGINVKLLTGQLDQFSASGNAFDFSSKVLITDNASIAFMVQDVNAAMKWSTGTNEKFMPTYHLGVAFRPEHYLLLTSTVRSVDERYDWSAGAELSFLKMLKVRTGIHQQRLSCGGGILLQMSSKLFIVINYAYSTDPILDENAIQTFDISVKLF